MDRFVIEGGKKLKGEVTISGAKNSALPIIAAALLTDTPVILENIPDVVDVHTMVKLIKHHGAKVSFEKNTLTIHTPRIKNIEAPYDIVRKMRASYYVLGSLVGREKAARVSLPGGCAIGPRPIDLHIKGLKALGVEINIDEGYVNARAGHIAGDDINLLGAKGTSVGATINTMLAAVQASGRTRIISAACEPEVVDVANFLSILGADIQGAGSSVIVINGPRSLGGATYRIIPDRIEAGTFAVAAAITKGDVVIAGVLPQDMIAVLDKLEEIGAVIVREPDRVEVRGAQNLLSTAVYVAPFPGFPTDMQAQFMALLSVASGTSTVKETIFENRFMQAMELSRMGADIKIDGDTAVIRGVKRLSGASVMASDLRASACLVLAGLAARGKTVVRRIYHLDRGYDRFEKKLRFLGARIRRIKE
ncbi:MAG TPA: UDP-N-acetylglucosamine 1-carboxyvinyltransferase [bacterium]